MNSHYAPQRVAQGQMDDVEIFTYLSTASGKVRHSCALTNLDRVYCWGIFPGDYTAASPPAGMQEELYLGQTGLTYEIYRNAYNNDMNSELNWSDLNRPIAIERGQFDFNWSQLVRETRDEHFINLSSGAHHNCGVSNENNIFCWGSFRRSQLGIYELAGGMVNFSNIPLRNHQTLNNENLYFNKLSAGEWHNCALTLDHKVYCWGDGTFGQVGMDPRTVPSDEVPVYSRAHQVTLSRVDLTQGERVVDVTAGTFSTCVLTNFTFGNGFCWGRNHRGQLGHGMKSSGSEFSIYDVFDPFPVDRGPLSP